MKKYLNLLQDVFYHGVPKEPVRVREGTTVTGTIGVANAVFSHDMSEGFPLLTTKKMGLRNIAVELEGFIKGITSKKWFQERGCTIWQEWANPLKVQKTLSNSKVEDENSLQQKIDLRKQIQLEEDDLGPIYGYQWRKFDESYGGSYKGVFPGTDQLKNIVDTLVSKPTDRRMYCSAWNPNQMSMMALPPCHLGWGVTVYGNKLNLAWTQRSCDLFLGVPYNIASYALLLKLLAKHAKLAEGNLTGLLIDNHLYNNQLEQAKLQLTRDPYPLPTVEIPNNFGEEFDFWKWNASQLVLKNYSFHPAIKAEVVV